MEFYPLSNVLRVRASTDFVRAKLDLLEEAGAKLDTDLFEFHDAFLLNTMVARGLLELGQLLRKGVQKVLNFVARLHRDHAHSPYPRNLLGAWLGGCNMQHRKSNRA
jgi:hypothetical protein